VVWVFSQKVSGNPAAANILTPKGKNCSVDSEVNDRFATSGDSRMKKVGGAPQGQGKSRGANINVYLCMVIFFVLKINLP